MNEPVAEPILSLAGLGYAYPGGRVALADVHATITRGERVGLVGPNGAGKTTLFLALCGVLPVKRGLARVAGIDPGDRGRRRELAGRVGIVFQHTDDQLFNATVFDDVAFGPLNLGLPADEVRRRVAEALAHVGLTGSESRSPFELSGGEKRRAALAGVLAMQPELLLLDEPSLELDPRGRRELIRVVNALPAAKLIASHDLELILDTCDRVLLLDGGRLIADGPTADILGDGGMMDDHGLEVPWRLR